jgi:hypothetical protein
MYIRSCRGAFLVYDVTDRASFQAIPGFLYILRECGEPNCACILVGNKTDRRGPFAVPREEAAAFAAGEDMAFIETSARDGTNLEELGRLLIREIRRRNANDPLPAPRPEVAPVRKSLFDFLPWNRARDRRAEERAEPEPEPARQPIRRERQPPEQIRRQTHTPVAMKDETPPVPTPVIHKEDKRALRKERQTSLELRLSAGGLSEPIDFEFDSFEFVVGGKSYFCPRFQAMFISKAVRNLILLDRTVDEYVIENVSHREDFELMMRLMSGDCVRVKDANCGSLFEFAKCLGNSELEHKLLDFRPDCDGLNVENVVDRLLECVRRNESIEREIEFIAIHLSDVKHLSRLSPEIFELVLENDKLRIESEDWLLSFVVDVMGGYPNLVRHVRCEYLSVEFVQLFIEALDVYSADSILFGTICHRLVLTRGDRQVTNVRSGSGMEDKGEVSRGGGFGHRGRGWRNDG